MSAIEALVAITYSTPELEVSIEEGTTRRRLEFKTNQRIEDYIAKSRLQDLLTVELFPSISERLVAITYATPDSEVSAEERAVRRELEAGINEDAEQYLVESRLQDALGFELYPCGEECFECSCMDA